MPSMNITVDYKKFLPALGKTVLTGICAGVSAYTGVPLGNMAAVAPHLVDMAASLGLRTTPEDLAGRLVFTAAQNATEELLKDLPLQGVPEEALQRYVANIDNDRLTERLEQALRNAPVVVDKEFFKDPARALPVADIAMALSRELEELTLSPIQVQTIAARFERCFVYAAYDEWQAHGADYAPLLKVLESTPLDDALNTTMAWERYRAYLRREPQQPMMGETFGLETVYVRLRAYFVEKKKKGKSGECEKAGSVLGHMDIERDSPPKARVVCVHEAIDEWLGENDVNDSIRLISGGPGSGKSSFAKMLAMELAARDCQVVFVPLNRLDPDEKLKDSVGAFVKEGNLLPFNPLETFDRPLLLILDGLDELSLQGRTGAEAAKRLMEKVSRLTENVNHSQLRLRCLVTGSDLSVQSVEQAFPLPQGTTLHLLPYLVLEKDIKNPDDPANLLAFDQRNVWWGKYGLASGQGFESLPEPLRDQKLEEMSGQPLLNYLLAVMYVQDPESLSGAGLPTIYETLLAGVHERGYAKKPHPALGTLELDDFFFVLEKIAVAIWQGNGRTASLAELKRHCDAPQVENLLKQFFGGMDQGLMRMLTTFYFRQAVQRGESETFEFTHKSFGEYLTARHLVATLESMCHEVRESQKNLRSSWSLASALAE